MRKLFTIFLKKTLIVFECGFKGDCKNAYSVVGTELRLPNTTRIHHIVREFGSIKIYRRVSGFCWKFYVSKMACFS